MPSRPKGGYTHENHRRRIGHRSSTPREAPELRRGARRWADARLRPRFGCVARYAPVEPGSPRRRPHLLYAFPPRPYSRRRSPPLRHQLRRTRETYPAPLRDRSRAFPPVLGLRDGGLGRVDDRRLRHDRLGATPRMPILHRPRRLPALVGPGGAPQREHRLQAGCRRRHVRVHGRHRVQPVRSRTGARRRYTPDRVFLPRRSPRSRPPDAFRRSTYRQRGKRTSCRPHPYLPGGGRAGPPHRSRTRLLRRGDRGRGRSEVRGLRDPAIGAATVQCDLVPVRDETGLPLDLQGQILHQLLVELDDIATLLAARVMVHPLRRQLVTRVTLSEVILAHDAELGQKVERPVHRGEAKLRMPALDPVVDLLRRKVSLPLQLVYDDPPLVG